VNPKHRRGDGSMYGTETAATPPVRSDEYTPGELYEYDAKKDQFVRAR
jgi:hypothetical protein